MNSETFDQEMATVGERIRQRRLALGLSQRQIASEGVSHTYISRIEANTRQPSVKALRKLAPKWMLPCTGLRPAKTVPQKNSRDSS